LTDTPKSANRLPSAVKPHNPTRRNPHYDRPKTITRQIPAKASEAQIEHWKEVAGHRNFGPWLRGVADAAAYVGCSPAGESPEQLDRYLAAAKKDGLSLAEWLRQAADGAATMAGV